MTWTILQPTAFMEVHLGAPLGWNFVSGRARIPGSPTLVKSYISRQRLWRSSRRDSLELPSVANRAMHLAGSEPLTAADALAIAERITNRSFKVQRIPRSALQALSVLLRPFAPGPSSLMVMAAADVPDIVDMTPLIQEFGVRLTPVDELRARSARISQERLSTSGLSS